MGGVGMAAMGAAFPIHMYQKHLENKAKHKEIVAIEKLTGLNKKFRELTKHERKSFVDNAFNASANVGLITSAADLRKDKVLTHLLTSHFGSLPADKIDSLLTGTAISTGSKRWILLNEKGKRPALLHEIGHLKAWEKGKGVKNAPIRESLYYPSYKSRTMRDEHNANKEVKKQLSRLDKKYLSHAIDTYRSAFLKKKSRSAHLIGNVVSGLGGVALGSVIAEGWRRKGKK